MDSKIQSLVERPANLAIEMGALAPPLLEQLKDFNLSAETVRMLQQDADAVCRCYLRGFVSDSQLKVMRKRLFKRIAGVVDKSQEMAHGQ